MPVALERPVDTLKELPRLHLETAVIIDFEGHTGSNLVRKIMDRYVGLRETARISPRDPIMPHRNGLNESTTAKRQ
eukprot:CAMPEP_0198363992 /NCGR_PEP_ID=MMETSP1450-20131203/151755_1 /TAXON_ID=753684 ORGANISM="Madagascaria erythrocladiodes, Strain CCMP3234" /NCGR_SAMPLE_ID=MMETSP1450 /ASSEMBLY_ACC=CAM_ASM_001115 /LENGTH=75 /DNA_ID=CAMNT_0044071369 /DNA_START=1265 /DNA_END=1492 /DNA_ORIENTATION=+